jgi:hypothetical protein
LVVHGIAGFDYERARRDLGIPNTYKVLAMIAIGKRGLKESLPPALKERQVPSDRKPLEQIVMNGRFKEERLVLVDKDNNDGTSTFVFGHRH